MNDTMRIMIVDDEKIVRESLYQWFKRYGHVVEAASSGREALMKLEEVAFDIMFVDIKMPEMDGLELLGKVKEAYPDTTVVIITAYGSIESAVEAMKIGASDYLLKPFKPDQLNLLIEKIANQRKLTDKYRYIKGLLEEITRFDNIIGQSEAMQSIFKLIPEVAQSDSSVLITGETGTGKELIAKAIHAKSLRSKGPFIAINCGAIPDTLLESELFGHQKGAFTGADKARKGFLEVASGGTLFLDEIGEISPKMQVDLLRVLEERKIIKIGDREPIETNFRLISSTRRDLAHEVAEGKFREDFYYRINVIILHVPPLRKRKEDIPLLVKHFLNKYSHETTKQVDHVVPEALEFLKGYEWPGNIRELENAIERAVVLSKSRTLRVEDFSFLQLPSLKVNGSQTLREREKDYVTQVLNEHDWNITHSAKVLGINRVTLHKMIKRYDLERP
ncbi:MAG: sigma-54 dependent transcriptional regulator [Desulfatiglans sp.]|nr:sigma-54 dependent transcriptional regulator [Thermodesulfobacteriota bacterium]MEE4352686.1 sigma-54 dependent transcriptional regulator [Desulfatiglans sp.]